MAASSELWQDPREREILLRALREYSDACEPPALTPGCPFAVTIGSGIRGCGDECMDLLARHNAPRSLEEIDIGEGLTMRRTRRPRSRRLNNPIASAYDAKEIYIRDESSRPPSTWRLASMLVRIVELVETPPVGDLTQVTQRRAAIDRLITRIEAKGLSFETHVLPHLRFVIGFAVFKEYFTPRILAGEGIPAASHGWLLAARDYIEAANSEDTLDAYSQAWEGILTTTMDWGRSATWEDLVEWSPPPSARSVDAPLTHHQTSDDLWIIERFTKTYLAEWSIPALRSEWKYLHGQQPFPCEPAEMRVREVPADDLAKVMADRLASKPRPSEPLSDMLIKPAVTFLRDGHRTEAAALFEAALRHDPNSAHALNNLGFCILPDDPERALRYLDAAIATGQADIEVCTANRVVALALLGRWTSAYGLASSHLEERANIQPRSSVWLWEIDSVLQGAEPTLIESLTLTAISREYTTLLYRGMAMAHHGYAAPLSDRARLTDLRRDVISPTIEAAMTISQRYRSRPTLTGRVHQLVEAVSLAVRRGLPHRLDWMPQSDQIRVTRSSPLLALRLALSARGYCVLVLRCTCLRHPAERSRESPSVYTLNVPRAILRSREIVVDGPRT